MSENLLTQEGEDLVVQEGDEDEGEDPHISIHCT